jgi:hypothetical protein
MEMEGHTEVPPALAPNHKNQYTQCVARMCGVCLRRFFNTYAYTDSSYLQGTRHNHNHKKGLIDRSEISSSLDLRSYIDIDQSRASRFCLSLVVASSSQTLVSSYSTQAEVGTRWQMAGDDKSSTCPALSLPHKKCPSPSSDRPATRPRPRAVREARSEKRPTNAAPLAPTPGPEPTNKALGTGDTSLRFSD